MSRGIGLTAVVAACTLALAGPARAITNGEADDGRHPYVGALVSHKKDRKKHLICSGTLISPTVFLTAAHCLLGEPSTLYVSFDAFVGAPDVGPDVELHKGTAIAHPDFSDETAPGDTHDIAVVRLDAPVQDVEPAPLPDVGVLDRLQDRGLLDDTTYVLVGYGREGFDGRRHYGGGSRRFASGAFRMLESFKLHLDQSGTTGGTCNGDSGGPVLVGRPLSPVGLTSDGDPECRESGVYYRVDTASARAFLDDFVTLRPPPRSQPAGDPAEATPPAGGPELVQASFTATFARAGRGAHVRRLSVRGMQPGTLVQLRCLAEKRSRSACPFRERRFYGRTSVDLHEAFGPRRLPRGTVVEVTASASRATALVSRWRIAREVTRRALCLPPGAPAPRRC